MSLRVVKNLKSAPSLTLPRGEGTAFTLAEVLITLGIIGVVAAIVMPNVINHFKVKQLEAQFKRADNIVTQAFQRSLNEYGYTKASELTFPNNKSNPESDANFRQLDSDIAQLNEIWEKQFKSIKFVNHVYGYDKKCTSWFGVNIRCPWYSGYLLSNGMFVTKLERQNGGINHPIQISFAFDTNGPFKGPNRNGYDIFTYYSYHNYLVPFAPCNPTNAATFNSANCYYYAHNNLNPNQYAKSKDYWDMLYKPESYWESK